MTLSRKLVETFRALHRNKYGEDISYHVAELQLEELADLVRLTIAKEETT